MGRWTGLYLYLKYRHIIKLQLVVLSNTSSSQRTGLEHSGANCRDEIAFGLALLWGDVCLACVCGTCVATSPKLWHCFCLIIVYPCLYLVRSSLCCAGEIRKALSILLFYSHVSGGISDCVGRIGHKLNRASNFRSSHK